MHGLITRAGSRAKKACIWFGPTLTFLLCAELAARHFYPQSSIPIVPDDILNHAFKPNTTMHQARFEPHGLPAYERRINNDGFVGERDISFSKSDRTYRIAYLGDSFIEGTCREEDAIPTIIGKRIKVPGRSRVEVINAGVSSYSPTLYYLMLKTRLLKFNPDLVVVNIDMTDVFDDSIYKATLKLDDAGDIIACAPGHPALATHRRTEQGLQEVPRLNALAEQVYARSSFVRIATDATASYRLRKKLQASKETWDSFAWCGKQRSPETERDVQWSMTMLKRLIHLARSHGIRVIVTAIPYRQQLEGSWSLQPMQDIASACREEGVPFLDPVPAFLKKIGERPLSEIYLPRDIHFTPEGYRILAEVQLEFLESAGLP